MANALFNTSAHVVGGSFLFRGNKNLSLDFCVITFDFPTHFKAVMASQCDFSVYYSCPIGFI